MNCSFRDLVRSLCLKSMLAIALVASAADFGWALNPQPLPPRYRTLGVVRTYQVLTVNPQSRFDAVLLNPQPLPPYPSPLRVSPIWVKPRIINGVLLR